MKKSVFRCGPMFSIARPIRPAPAFYSAPRSFPTLAHRDGFLCAFHDAISIVILRPAQLLQAGRRISPGFSVFSAVLRVLRVKSLLAANLVRSASPNPPRPSVDFTPSQCQSPPHLNRKGASHVPLLNSGRVHLRSFSVPDQKSAKS